MFSIHINSTSPRLHRHYPLALLPMWEAGQKMFPFYLETLSALVPWVSYFWVSPLCPPIQCLPTASTSSLAAQGLGFSQASAGNTQFTLFPDGPTGSLGGPWSVLSPVHLLQKFPKFLNIYPLLVGNLFASYTLCFILFLIFHWTPDSYLFPLPGPLSQTFTWLASLFVQASLNIGVFFSERSSVTPHSVVATPHPSSLSKSHMPCPPGSLSK